MDKRTEGLLAALRDGLAGWLTYEARCGTSPAYTEYLLYAPIVRIAAHLGWTVHVEVALPRSARQGKAPRGDKPRCDFVFADAEARIWIAMEVKWVRRPGAVDVRGDVAKLRRIRPAGRLADAYHVTSRFVLVAYTLRGGGTAERISTKPPLDAIGGPSFRTHGHERGVRVFEVPCQEAGGDGATNRSPRRARRVARPAR